MRIEGKERTMTAQTTMCAFDRAADKAQPAASLILGTLLLISP
jgi:hypothetical protein